MLVEEYAEELPPVKGFNVVHSPLMRDDGRSITVPSTEPGTGKLGDARRVIGHGGRIVGAAHHAVAERHASRAPLRDGKAFGAGFSQSERGRTQCKDQGQSKRLFHES